MGLGNWLRDLTKESDIFGRVVSLYVAKGREHKTTTGGLFSFFLVIAIFFYSYEAALPIYYHTDPTYTLTTTFIQDPGQLNTTDPDFYFAINLSTSYAQINPRGNYHYFSYAFTQVTCLQSSQVCTYTDLGLQACSAEFFDTYPQMLDFANTSYCPTSKVYNLSGEPLGDFYPDKSSAYILLTVKGCVNITNSTTNYTCAPQEEIDYVLSDPDLSVYIIFSNNYVVITDYEVPIKKVVGFAGGRIAPRDFELHFTEYLDQVTVDSNDGLINANHTYYDSFLVNPLSQVLATSDPSSDELYFSMIFRRSQLGTKYKRQYLNLAGCLSNIGGFSLSMMAATGFLMYAYAQLKYKIFFSNNLYRFSEKPKMGFFNPNTSIELPLLDPNTSQNIDDPPQVSARIGNSRIGRYLAGKAHPEYFREGKLVVNLKDFMAYNYTFGLVKNKQTEKIARAEKKIGVDSDIINMARLSKHIEKLRDFTLEPIQRCLFNSIKDPFVLVEDPEPEVPFEKYQTAFKQKDQFTKHIKYDQLELCARRYMAYIRLSKDTNNRMNAKIIEQLDRDMVDFFNEVRDIIGEDFDKLPEVFADSMLVFRERDKKYK